MPARRSKRPVNTTSTTVRVPAFCDWRQSPVVYPVTSQSWSLGAYPRSEGGLKEGRKPTTLFSEGTRSVIAAMKKQGWALGVPLLERGRAGPGPRGLLRQDHEACAIQGDVQGHEPDGVRGQAQRLRLGERDFDFRTAPSATPPRIASPRSASPPRR